MNAIFWLTLFLCSAPLWYLLGARVERGKIEKQKALHEEERYQRSIRYGTVKLSSVKIRR